MSDMVNIRGKVISAYPNEVWATKVSKMSDNQVFAIYKNLQKSKKISN